MKFFVAAATVAVVLAAEDKGAATDDKKTTAEGSCKAGIQIATFTDAECTKPNKDAEDKAVVVKPDADALKVINEACNTLDSTEKAAMPGSDDFGSLSVKCDTDAMTTTMFKSDDCTANAKADKTTALTWGKCTEIALPDGKTKLYSKTTGAAALQAAAAAALAFVATQF